MLSSLYSPKACSILLNTSLIAEKDIHHSDKITPVVAKLLPKIPITGFYAVYQIKFITYNEESVIV